MLIAAAEAAFVDFLSQIEATSFWHRRTHTLLTALSGGPDSLALALIAERVATAQNISHKALIIDHGLRDNSSEEASNIQAQMRIRGMSAEVLTITAPRPEADISNGRVHIACIFWPGQLTRKTPAFYLPIIAAIRQRQSPCVWQGGLACAVWLGLPRYASIRGRCLRARFYLSANNSLFSYVIS